MISFNEHPIDALLTVNRTFHSFGRSPSSLKSAAINTDCLIVALLAKSKQTISLYHSTLVQLKAIFIQHLFQENRGLRLCRIPKKVRQPPSQTKQKKTLQLRLITIFRLLKITFIMCSSCKVSKMVKSKQSGVPSQLLCGLTHSEHFTVLIPTPIPALLPIIADP